MINWYFGWGSILAAFISGATIGLFFHRENFLGGYTSFQRRLVRLGHIAMAALGLMNVVYAQSLVATDIVAPRIVSVAWIVGTVAMPTVCFLAAWRSRLRHLFFIPVTALIIAVVQTLRIGPP